MAAEKLDLGGQYRVLTTAERTAINPTLRSALLKWANHTGEWSGPRLRDLHLDRLFRTDRLLRLTANLAVVTLVLLLPFAAAAPVQNQPLVLSSVAATGYEPGSYSGGGQARGLLAAGRDPMTATAEGAKPIRTYTIGKQDTLSSLSNYFEISPEAIAFSNGITDPLNLQIGRELMIPPAEGALYTVQASDSVEAVAGRFKVDPAVIMSYNRLYFEPEHFAPGQLIFVTGATVPALVYQTVEPARAAPVAAVTRPTTRGFVQTGSLAWPVPGRLTQVFWAAHKGVDVAAPYGTGIAVPLSGTVISTGWVAVGGLSVRVRHDSGLITGYYHMSSVYANVGQHVAQGQVVGAIGLTGVTTGPHVHWECQVGSVLVDCLSQ